MPPVPFSQSTLQYISLLGVSQWSLGWMMPSPQVLPMPLLDALELLVPPPAPPVEPPQLHMLNERPSSLQACTPPFGLPTQEQVCVVPGTQPLLPVDVLPPPFPPQPANPASPTSTPATKISLDRTAIFAPES
jgi:hypothetical protein